MFPGAGCFDRGVEGEEICLAEMSAIILTMLEISFILSFRAVISFTLSPAIFSTAFILSVATFPSSAAELPSVAAFWA